MILRKKILLSGRYFGVYTLYTPLSIKDLRKDFVFFLAFFAVFTLSGCRTLPDGSGWGQDAIWPVNGRKIAEAAHDAFFNPNTLIPLAGAGIFYAGDFDEKVSHWANKHHPIFGSEDRAVDVRSSLKTILEAETFVTAIATPSGDEPSEWIYSKSKGIGVEIAAMKANHYSTDLIKSESNRIRPNGANDLSFPSGCSSSAFSYATLSNRNISYIEIDPGWKRSLQFGNLCLASGVAWSRIESGAHYPSDVLAGAALGHFLSAFIHDAFLGLPENEGVRFSVIPFEGGAMAQLSFHF